MDRHAPPAALEPRLERVPLLDAARLRRRTARLGRRPRPEVLARLEADLARAEARLAARAAAVPTTIRYPEDLPVSARRDELLVAVRDHQVVVVAGETGSGKTTQIPKVLLEAGYGVRGTIGHTQPRRIAARAVAERLAEELGEEGVGGAVGYKVRFTDEVSDRTLVKLLTDGVLLAEIGSDPDLLRYDAVVVDEAHERSLNVDFLLGYLHRLLPRRPDLRLVITSATIDPQRFADHFAPVAGPVPVVEVSGRTYPVEIRYRPPDDDVDQVQAVVDAVRELESQPPGDVLVFLSGEREIRDCADALRGEHLRGTEVLPLYGRLSSAEQHRVFSAHDGRRVVLSTNVAETSLTVPGIRYVVDTGTARISRYSLRSKVQRLPIEPVSRASADQRAGRCGRVAEGVAIRLYSEEDYEGRPRFTEPEVQRTNLASVVLQMAALGLGDVQDFPFLDAPDRRQVRDGVQLLEELGAFAPGGGAAASPQLTPVGRQLAQLPVDPRVGRMVLAGAEHACLHDVLVVAAALSIQDPRERPADAQERAAALHGRFADPTSDFLGITNLWRYVYEQQDALSSSAFRRLCKAELLHYLRIREWQDLYAQLRQVARSLGLPKPVAGGEVDGDALHRALLTGLLSQVGLRVGDTRDFQGARGTRFVIGSGSALARKPPTWVVAADLVETSRLYARTCARIDPEWVEAAAQHLVKRTYAEPHWSAKRASVVAKERVTLYGLPLVVGRTVQYGRIDPELSRELFIRHALVEGDWRAPHAFLRANAALLAEAEELEERTRRRGAVVDDEARYAFYDERVPADVVSGRHFDAWWKQERRRRPDLLDMPRSMLLDAEVAAEADTEHPTVWTSGDLSVPLSYAFEPGTAADGVTAHVPLALLNRLPVDAFAWQVPGYRLELVTELLRSLPKALRRQLVPAPDTARLLLGRVDDAAGEEPLLDALARELKRLKGIDVPPDAWDWSKVPAHLRVRFRVEDDAGRVVGEGEDLDDLRHRLAPALRRSLAAAVDDVERSGLRSWPDDLTALPRSVRRDVGGRLVEAFPALVDEGATAAVRALGSAREQAAAHSRGVRRLLALDVPPPVRAAVGRLDGTSRLSLAASPHGSVDALLADVADAVVDAAVASRGGPAWSAQEYAALRDAVRTDGPRLAEDGVRQVAAVLRLGAQARTALDGLRRAGLDVAVADVEGQLDALVRPGFVTDAGLARLRHLQRYLRAALTRMQALPADARRDAERTAVVHRLLDALDDARAAGRDVDAARWMLEELRVSLWAQSLGTAHPVSEKRVLKALGAT